MNAYITILIGGIQGEGIASTAINLMKALSELGYYTFGERKFSSTIKGANTHTIITISNHPVHCCEHHYDVILAFDKDTVMLNRSDLKPHGALLVDETVDAGVVDHSAEKIMVLPMTSLAKKHGTLLMKNTCAIGFLGRVLQLEQSALEESLLNTYQNRTEEVVKQNIEVLNAAYKHETNQLMKLSLLPAKDGTDAPLVLMMGNDAITLGALMAGCRFVAAYPITPASDMMDVMGRALRSEGGIMIQTEDEIAAVIMCIGAGYAGVRSMTATSGPGLSLMVEGMGLAGMTETPIVIVDAQRAGPSTGMPTRTEQGDVSFLYYGGHGEYPMIILTPSTIHECYDLTIDAFQLADQYQCPVIVLTDLNLCLSPQTIPELTYKPVRIDRGEIILKEDQHKNTGEPYPRYAQTETGISPRSFPGMAGGIHHATGLEHSITGQPTDQPINRTMMMDKRLRKTIQLEDENAVHIEENDGKLLCLTYGSPWGVLKEAMKDKKLPVDIAHISRIRPLPVKQLSRLLNGYHKIVVMEQNHNGQLAGILKHELGMNDKILSLTRYDGLSFKTKNVYEALEGWCKEWK